MKYMRKENIFLEKDIMEMKEGLKSEGWEFHELLPDGKSVKS